EGLEPFFIWKWRPRYACHGDRGSAGVFFYVECHFACDVRIEHFSFVYPEAMGEGSPSSTNEVIEDRSVAAHQRVLTAGCTGRAPWPRRFWIGSIHCPRLSHGTVP